MLSILICLALAIVIGALLAVTTVKVSVSDRQPGQSAFRFTFTVVWPSGPVTYSWPRR